MLVRLIACVLFVFGIVSPLFSQTCQIQFDIDCSELEPGIGSKSCSELACIGFAFCPEFTMEVISDNTVKVIRAAEGGESGYIYWVPDQTNIRLELMGPALALYQHTDD
jgi:hypothetical protein